MACRALRELTRPAAGALVAVVSLAGCVADASDAVTPPTVVSSAAPSGTVATEVSVESARAADAVALAVTRAWLSHDTRLDRRPTDTARRLALRWLAPSLRREVETFAGVAQPGAAWADWTRRHAHAIVDARIGGDDRPPDTVDVAHRQVLATLTLRGDHGWVQAQSVTIFLRLSRSSGTWLVSDIRSIDGQ